MTRRPTKPAMARRQFERVSALATAAQAPFAPPPARKPRP